MEHADGISPRHRRVRPLPYALLVPAILALGLMLGYPIVRLVTLSLQEFGLKQQFGAAADWVGLANYRGHPHDEEFWAVLRRTVVFCCRQRVPDHGVRNADCTAAEAARVEDAAADDAGSDAGVVHARTDQHGDLAVDLRHAVRHRQLGSSGATGPVVVGESDHVLLRGDDHRGLDGDPVRRLHPVRRPDPDTRGTMEAQQSTAPVRTSASATSCCRR